MRPTQCHEQPSKSAFFLGEVVDSKKVFGRNRCLNRGGSLTVRSKTLRNGERDSGGNLLPAWQTAPTLPQPGVRLIQSTIDRFGDFADWRPQKGIQLQWSNNPLVQIDEAIIHITVHLLNITNNQLYFLCSTKKTQLITMLHLTSSHG